MTFTMNAKRHMSSQSAHFAQANGSCAQTASMKRANSIIMTMDAIILASILICAILALVSLLGLIRVSILILVLVVLVSEYLYTPEKRWKAVL